MNRPERIRFFITESCRRLDNSFKNYMYPRQILLGDTTLPLLEGSSLTFGINRQGKISFRIRLETEEYEEPLNIGVPFTQVESVAIKEESAKHPEFVILFRLKNRALERFIELCGPMLDNPVGDGNRRSMSKYLTVIFGNDPNMEDKNNSVHCRVALRANKFTFPFSTAKKILLQDLPIMWQDLVDDAEGRRKRTGVQNNQELIDEMDDEAFDWFMRFMSLRWVHNPEGGYLLARKGNPIANQVPQEAPLLPNELLMEPQSSKRVTYSVTGSDSPISTCSHHSRESNSSEATIRVD